MPLTKLDNLISSKTGRYLYVSPDDFNASDALDNRGNSPTRPFLTIQRAFLEVARYSYVPGQENDRFDQFTIMLSPGNHYIDNRPGILNPEEIVPFGFDQATGEWTDDSILDLGNPNNILYKFNGPNGGATIPRGTSLVGMDLRRTRLHPLYVPDPADKDVGRTTLFNVTGGCYFWQFTILDGDVEPNSPLYDENERIGKVYSQPNSTVTQIPYYSHHKICNFEFADRDDLGLLYRKIARAFSLFQPTIDDPGEFAQRPQENRIVGPLQDAIRIDAIKVDNLPNTNLKVTVKTKVNHGYYVGQSVAVANLRSTLPAGANEPIPLLNDPLTGVFAVSEISISDPKEFSYIVSNRNAAAVGLADKEGQFITPPDLDTNAITQAEIDSVESASPYVFNVSIRSTWGICGIHADGSKATGFKSMVIAQYTGVSLQRDDRAFIRYDEFSNTWNQAPLTDAFATTPYHTKGDAYWKDDWRNFHVKASNDAFIQNVSIFAVGFADHFLMESGGDMSITNSNSNFGNTSLHAIGFKGFAFNQDKGGYIDAIIPPRTVTTQERKLQYYTFDQVKTRSDLALNNDGADGTSSLTAKLYLGHDEAENVLQKPSTVVNGYKVGAKAQDKLFVKLDSAIGFEGSIRSADIAPSGYKKWDLALEVVSPSVSTGVSNLDQDAANLIDLNRDFIASEAYGYITRKYPYILTRPVTITKCRRDIGYILEAITSDLRVGGNVNSLQAGQSYYIGNELNYINSEKEETIEAFNYARSLAIAAMRNWEFYVDGCSTINGQAIVTIPSSISTVGIVEGMLVSAIVSGGQNNPIPANTYVKRIVSNTQFELGNRNNTDVVTAVATVTSSLRINFELTSGRYSASSGRNFDAANLIKLNKDFIAEEALVLAKQQFPSVIVPSDEKCKRDIGFVLDAVAKDITTFGNAGIVEAAEAYVGAGNRFRDAKNLILANKKEIVDKAAAKLAIEFPDFYYGGEGFTNGGDEQTNVYSRYKDAYRLIQLNRDEIVDGAFNQIEEQFPEFVNPNSDKCRRDIGYFVDAISTDLTTLGNAYSIAFVKQYFKEDKVNGKILSFVVAASTVRSNQANRIYRNIPGVAVTGDGVNAVFTVRRDASGAVAEITIVNGGYKFAVGNQVRINGASVGGTAVVDDIILNVTDVETAWITDGLQGEETQSIAAFTAAVEFCKLAISNQLTAKDLTLTGDPLPGDDRSGVSIFGEVGNTNNNTDPQSCSNVKSTLNTLSTIVFDRIRAGDLVTSTTQISALPAINYGSSPETQEKCKRDIGYIVEAVADDIALGGNYNVIEATKAYFDSTGTTLLTNGLEGEIAQSVAAFVAARDLCYAAVTNQLNFRDPDISEGPSVQNGAGDNISNTDPAACADVRSAIETLFAIITSKLQNPTSNFPTLQYNAGASSLEGELDISVYAFKKVRDLAILAMRNWRTGDGTPSDALYQKTANNTLNYVVDLTVDTTTAGIPACADTAYAIATEFDILTGALNNTAPLPPKNFGSNEYLERYVPQTDSSVLNDVQDPGNKCAGTKDAIIELTRVITSIIQNGVESEELVSQTVNTTSFAARATLFKVSGANPHNLETGTPIRLVAVPRKDPATGKPVNVDKKFVRLPKGFNTNTKYYVIAPGKITFPYNYTRGGAASKFRNTQSFMLATSIENATAGIYIYSSETEGVHPDVQIELHQYVTDTPYDLHRYTAELVSSRIFRSTTNHIFDTAFNGAEVQKVFFRPLDGLTTNTSLQTLPAKTSGGRLDVDRTFYVGRASTYDLDVEYPSKSGDYNKEFSIYLTKEDAINRQNAVQFSFPSGGKFFVFAKRRRSPVGFDPVQNGWFVNSFLENNEIRERLILNDPSRGSSYVNKPPKTPDSFFFRFEDTRETKDKIYRLRYVMPSYRDDVRDPLRGFVIKVRADEKRKLVPQRILLKPVSSNDPKLATFFEVGVQNPQRLGLPGSAALYDPYNPVNAKRIAGTATKSNVSFTIQSAKQVGDYLEIVAFDHGLDVETLKAKLFVTVKVDQPQGGNGNFIEGRRIAWSGASFGSAIVHSWFGTENVEGKSEEFNYLILKDIEGELKFDPRRRTTFKQSIPGQSDVFANLNSEPNFGKEDKSKFLYAVEDSNVYTLTPGDIVTDDAARQYRIVTVKDVPDLEQTYYIYEIEEVQRRIPRQQDGVYYLTVIRGDISPFPTGAGVGTNFRNFKFSQPVSRLFPLTFKNDPLLFQYDGSDDRGGIRDTTILDPNATISAADNYIHGLVTVNDAKNSVTKEAVLDFVRDPGSGRYVFEGEAALQAQEGSAGSGAEERIIPIAGNSQFPLEQKIFVELRRPSIARAGNHTFEYLGFGPGNYSTGFPARQTVILTDVQDFYAQAKKQDAGIVFYTGINSNGELYIGNRKINAITGQEIFLDAAILEEDETEDGDFGSLVTVFEDPVTFENIVTLNAPPNLKNFINSPVEINVDPEFEARMTPPSLRIVSRPGSRRALLPGDDDALLDTNIAGDIIIDKNRVRAAIFDMNTRGTQRYSFRTAVNNITPNQFTTGPKARFNSSQTLFFGSSVPLSGDVILKGAEVGYTGSIGWIYANSYVDYRLNAPPGQESSIDIIGVELYSNLNVVRLIFQVGKVNFSQDNPGASLGITKATQIRITGATGPLSVINGVHNIYDAPSEGYEYLESNGYVYILTSRSSEAILSGTAPYIFSVNSVVQPTIAIARSDSQWKEVGVIGAEALRTFTETYGDYRLGINTLARALSSDYVNGYVETTRTRPRANLDVVGNTFISGKLQTNFSDLNGGVPQRTNHAFIVGGDSNNPNSTASLRIATTTFADENRQSGATANTNGARIGINVSDVDLDKNLVVSGDARITGDFTFQSDIDVNGGDIRSTSAIFTLANQSTTTTLSLGGFATSINVGNLATSQQIINVGNAVTGQTRLNIHTASNDSVINIGTISNALTNKSIITVGGAYNNQPESIFRIKNYQTVLDGNLIISGDSINLTNTSGEFSIFPDNINTLRIAETANQLIIGGVSGITRIRNGLTVDGQTILNSDITQNGGNRNSSVGIERNIFGTIVIASISRSANIVTINTVNQHNLSTGNLVTIECGIEEVETVLPVSITVINSNAFTYLNSGSDIELTSTTGVVLTGVGNAQSTGNLANTNVDFYQFIPQIAKRVFLQTVINNKILVDQITNETFFTGFKHYFSEGNPVRFVTTGNLNNVDTDTTYYIRAKDETGFTLSTSADGALHPIGLIGSSTDAGNAAIYLDYTAIDTVGSVSISATQTTIELNNPQGISINDFLLIGTEIVRTTNFPSPNKPYIVSVARGQDGTQPVAHPDNTRVAKLFRQQNAAFIFPNPTTPTATSLNLSDFSGTFRLNDILRLNKGTSAEEFVRITQINTADAQSFIINDGDFGSEAAPKNPLTTFSVVSTSGDTFALGDVTIGFDDGVNSSTASVVNNILNSGGGNLKVHNSIELSGNTTTSTPQKQYFVITNGNTPKFYVESATGNTRLYDGANLRIFKDSYFLSGSFDKTRLDIASDIAFEVLGTSGNTRISGTLTVGNNFTIKNGLSGSNTFTVDSSTGTTFVGRHLTINGIASASPSSAVTSLQITNLGVNGNKPFRIKQDSSIDAFGKNNFYNINGGRRTIYVTSTGGVVSTPLETNVNYLVRPSSNLTLNLPSTAITGDLIRFVDVVGALRFNIGLIINAPSGVRIQGDASGGFGQLIVNTPNAAFGLLFVGESDANGTGIPEESRGWWLTEI
jgi:hypothetical protein